MRVAYIPDAYRFGSVRVASNVIGLGEEAEYLWSGVVGLTVSIPECVKATPPLDSTPSITRGFRVSSTLLVLELIHWPSVQFRTGQATDFRVPLLPCLYPRGSPAR
jgi:hypothetical protein